MTPLAKPLLPLLITAVLAAAASAALADTFKHKKTGESFDARLTGEVLMGLHKVIMPNGRTDYVNLNDYDVEKNDKGGPLKPFMAWLGFTVEQVPLPTGCPGYPGQGVAVETVYPDSAAKRAGVKRNDIILSIDKRTVRSPNAVFEILRLEKAARPLTLTIRRAESDLTLEITPDNFFDSTLLLCTAVKGPIEEGFAAVFAETLREAEDMKARVLLVEIDSPGGLTSEATQAAGALMQLKGIKTIAFIRTGTTNGAISAAALIALSCDEIYMAEGTRIGAATPYTRAPSTGDTMVDQKFLSAWRAQFKTVAQAKKRPPPLCEAMVDARLSVWGARYPDGTTQCVIADGRADAHKTCSAPGRTPAELVQISKTDELVSLSASDAVKWGVARGIASGYDEVCSAEHIRQPCVIYTTVFETLATMQARLAQGKAEFAREVERYNTYVQRWNELLRLRDKTGHVTKTVTVPGPLREVPGYVYLPSVGWVYAPDYVPTTVTKTRQDFDWATYANLTREMEAQLKAMIQSLLIQAQFAKKYPELKVDTKEIRRLLDEHRKSLGEMRGQR